MVSSFARESRAVIASKATPSLGPGMRPVPSSVDEMTLKVVQAYLRCFQVGVQGYQEYGQLLLGYIEHHPARWLGIPSPMDITEKAFQWYQITTSNMLAFNPSLVRYKVEQYRIPQLMSTAPLHADTELSAFDQRLSHVEDRVKYVTSFVHDLRHARLNLQAENVQQDNGRDGDDDPAVCESVAMKSAITNLNLIASAVQSCRIGETVAWKRISEKYPGAELFAIDADSRSFEISESGAFDGRADILISVPRTLRSGRPSSISLTIAARVVGQLSMAGEIEISDFHIAA
jgi:hypothetical protein